MVVDGAGGPGGMSGGAAASAPRKGVGIRHCRAARREWGGQFGWFLMGFRDRNGAPKCHLFALFFRSTLSMEERFGARLGK